MKKLLIFFTCLFVLSCAACTKAPAQDSSQNNNAVETGTNAAENNKAPSAKAEAKGDVNIGDRFAFAGLKSEDLVPSFAIEISELENSERGDNPKKDSVYLYTGTNKDVITTDQLNDYFSKLYQTVKGAADDGKVYKGGAFGDTKLGEEITELIKVDKSFGDYSCLFKHEGVWYKFTASHKVQNKKFVKDYPEKYFGVAIAVQAWIVTE